jgi:hypothetical protein
LICRNLEIKNKIHKKVLWIGELKFNFAEGSFRVRKGRKKKLKIAVEVCGKGRFQSGL